LYDRYPEPAVICLECPVALVRELLEKQEVVLFRDWGTREDELGEGTDGFPDF
jgi:hypothetical protein